MHPILVRILKQGIPVALILAVIGFLMAEAAGLVFAMQSGGDSTVRVTVGDAPASAGGSGGEDLTRALRRRLPLTLAAWGFGLTAAFELLVGLWRGRKSNASAAAVPTEDETEKLLNQLLKQADVAEANRTTTSTDTPPPGTSCPAPPASENSPVNN